MLSGFQPNTSDALEWAGALAALDAGQLSLAPNELLVVDGTGALSYSGATPADALTITNDCAVGSLNGVTMPTPSAGQTAVFLRRETYTSSTANLGAHDIAFPTGTGWDNFVSGSVWYKDSIAGVWRMALQKQYDNGANDNTWTLCPVPSSGTTGWVMRYHSNMNANSEVRMVAYFRCT